jgi:hypothetical protein
VVPKPTKAAPASVATTSVSARPVSMRASRLQSSAKRALTVPRCGSAALNVMLRQCGPGRALSAPSWYSSEPSARHTSR